MIKEKGGAPNLMEMDNTIEGEEVNEIVEKFNNDTKLEDEDYDVVVGKFDFHFAIHIFTITKMGCSSLT
jgi:hypothetical protein